MTTLPDTPTTTRLARRLVEAGRGLPLDGESAHLARLHLLDTISSIVVCRDLHAADVALRSATANGTGTTPILGTDERAGLIDAAFASSIIAHGAEINDFCPSAFVQPGPGVVATALCAAHDRRRSGAVALRAIIAGYELSCRLPKAIGNETLRTAGIANHGLGSLFGVGAAAAIVLDLDEPSVDDLLAYLGQQASGSWQWLLDHEHLEKAFVFGGMAVHNGLHAALLVEAGFSGVSDSLDHPGGWLALGPLAGRTTDGFAEAMRTLFDDSELPLVGFKQHPVGGPVQPVIEAMLALIDGRRSRVFDSVHVEMPSNGRTFAGAQMPALNIPYLLTIIALDGELDFVSAQSMDRFADPALADTMAKVTVTHDPSQDTIPRSESATVTIRWDDGTSDSIHVEFVRGYPSHPMSSDDVVAKSRRLLGRHLTETRAEEVIDLCLRIDELDTVDDLVGAIAR